MPLSAPLRQVLRSSVAAPLISRRALTSTSHLAAKSPIGEAISQVAKAEGGTEKGSRSAALQSEATKALNGQNSSSQGQSSSSKSPIGEVISQVAKSEGGTGKGSQSAKLQSEATKALNDQNTNSRTQSGSGSGAMSSRQQSQADREANFAQAADQVGEKLAKNPGSVTAEDASKVQSREHRAFGQVSKDGVSAEASRVVDGSQ